MADNQRAGDLLKNLNPMNKTSGQKYVFRQMKTRLNDFFEIYPSGEIVLKRPARLRSTSAKVEVEDVERRTRYETQINFFILKVFCKMFLFKFQNFYF